MTLSYGEFSAALPREKRLSDAVWTQLVLRPISLPVAWLLYRTGLSGNAVSTLGLVSAIIGCALLTAPDLNLALAGAGVIALVALLDCVDGNIARATKQTGPNGEFIDASVGYTVYAFMPIALAVHAALAGSSQNVSSITLLVLGAMAASLNIYARLIYQKYEAMQMKMAQAVGDVRAGGASKLVKKISNDVGLGGIMTPMLALAVFLGAEFYYLLFYTVVFSIVALGTITTKAIAVLRKQ
jgi:phosphatidylglycerophosphate synthase